MANILYGDLGSERMIYADEGANADVVKAIYSNTERLAAGFIACSATHGIWFRSEKYNARGAGYLSGEYAELPTFPPDRISEIEFCNIPEFEAQSRTGSIKLGTSEELPLTEFAASVILTNIITAFEKKTTVCVAMGDYNGSENEYLNAGLMLCKKLISVLPKSIQPYVSYFVGGLYPFNKIMNANIVVVPQRYKELMRASGKHSFINSIIDVSLTSYDGFISDYAKYMAGIIFGNEIDEKVETLNECVLKSKRKLPWDNFSIRLYELLFRFKNTIEKDEVSKRTVERQVNALSGEKLIDMERLKQIYPEITGLQESANKSKHEKELKLLLSKLDELKAKAQEVNEEAQKLNLSISLGNCGFKTLEDIENTENELKKLDTQKLRECLDAGSQAQLTDKERDDIEHKTNEIIKILADIDNLRESMEDDVAEQKAAYVSKENLKEFENAFCKLKAQTKNAMEKSDLAQLKELVEQFEILQKKVNDELESKDDELNDAVDTMRSETEIMINRINEYISRNSVVPLRFDDIKLSGPHSDKHCMTREAGLGKLKDILAGVKIVEYPHITFFNRISEAKEKLRENADLDRPFLKSTLFSAKNSEDSQKLIKSIYVSCRESGEDHYMSITEKEIIEGATLAFLGDVSKVICSVINDTYYIECEWVELNKDKFEFYVSDEVFIHMAFMAVKYLTEKNVDLHKKRNCVEYVFESDENSIEMLKNLNCQKLFTLMCLKFSSYLSMIDFTDVQDFIDDTRGGKGSQYILPYRSLDIPLKISSLPIVSSRKTINKEILGSLCSTDFINCPALALRFHRNKP